MRQTFPTPEELAWLLAGANAAGIDRISVTESAEQHGLLPEYSMAVHRTLRISCHRRAPRVDPVRVKRRGAGITCQIRRLPAHYHARWWTDRSKRGSQEIPLLRLVTGTDPFQVAAEVVGGAVDHVLGPRADSDVPPIAERIVRFLAGARREAVTRIECSERAVEAPESARGRGAGLIREIDVFLDREPRRVSLRLSWGLTAGASGYALEVRIPGSAASRAAVAGDRVSEAELPGGELDRLGPLLADAAAVRHALTVLRRTAR